MEVIQSLRRSEFPDDTRGALKHLERVCVSQTESNVTIPGLKEVRPIDVPAEFLEEFVFHQLDWQGNPRHLTAIQELQLLDILCTYFQDCKNGALFRSVFFRLFPLEMAPSSYRTLVLCKSVSLSIAANSASFLTCVAEWLSRDCISNSQDGAHLPSLSSAVARTIVQDYCLLQSSPSKGVANLASTSPEFACFFVRAITQMFDMTGSPQYSYGSPPGALLSTIADWLGDNPAILRTPVSLPQNTSPPRRQALLTAPLLGLIRWCIKSPLVEVACRNTLRRSEEESISDSKATAIVTAAKTQLALTSVYSNLHLAVLNCFMVQMEESNTPQIAGKKPAMEPLSTGQMLSLAQELILLERKIKTEIAPSVRQVSEGKEPSPKISEEEIAMTVSIDRLAQTIQVAKATDALLVQSGDLKNLADFLPENPLMKLVAARWGYL